MDEDGKILIEVGDEVLLREPEEGEYVPAGWHRVNRIYEDGSLGVGDKSGVWPWRVISINKNPNTYPN